MSVIKKLGYYVCGNFSLLMNRPMPFFHYSCMNIIIMLIIYKKCVFPFFAIIRQPFVLIFQKFFENYMSF